MIVQAMCDVYKRDCQNGVHQPGHVYKMALYGPLASLDRTTEAYDAAGEISGTGYVAGGKALTGRECEVSDDGAGVVTFDDQSWNPASIPGARGALVYNDTAPGKPTLAVIDFGREYVSTEGNFLVRIPTELLRIA